MYKDPQGRTVLEGDGQWGFKVTVDGDDLLVDPARATWFGGDSDPEDNGETASGVMTKGHPDLLGCALPIGGFNVTAGSPMPHLPWNIQVRIYCPATNKDVTVPLIDLGPSKPPRANAQIDLTKATFRALGVPPSQGELRCRFRVLGGAKYVG